MTASRRPLRIGMFSYRLPVADQKRGGIERAAHTLADGLIRRGHDVTVFSHDARPEGAGYEVRPLPWKGFVETWLGRRLTMGYLGNVLAVLPDYSKFDVIVMHGDSLFAPLAGRPVLRIMHGSALGEARSATSWGRRALQFGVYCQELLTAMTQDGVVAVSENTARDNPYVCRVIPHGVDPSVFRPMRGQRTSEPSVLFVGSLDGRKRGRFLLDGFLNVVRERHPDATLTIVGDRGPAHQRVTYLTGVSDTELSRLYARAWVYASPSTYEGFGLPYLEAMACGTPVVATSNPGSKEVLGDGAFGLLPVDDDFALTVAGLLSDDARCAAMAAAGLKRAQDYSLERMIDSYEQMLVDLSEVHAGSIASV